LSDDAIDALWVAMADVYGHRWTSAYGTDPQAGAGGTWRRGLAGLEQRQLGMGIDACIASSEAWPPTLPEFRALCLGVPSLATVRHELHEATPTRSPFTVLVWQGIDGYAFRIGSREQNDRAIRDAYELAREHVMRGGALPEPVAGELVHEVREPVPANPEVAQAAIAEALALLHAVLPPDPEPSTDERPKAEIEAELKTHYDGKRKAAGE